MEFIDPRKSYNYIVSNYQIRPSTNGWYLFDCPFCDGWNKFTRSVHFQYNITKCFRCSFRGGVIEFAAEVEGLELSEAKKMLWRIEPAKISLEDISDVATKNFYLSDADVILPEGFTSILQGNSALGIRARRYLTNRGFDLEELDREGFGYCDKHYEGESGEDEKEIKNKDFYGYIIVPFRRAGKLCYYLGRAFLPDLFLRYKNPPVEYVGVGKSEVIFNEQALYLYKAVFVSEGWPDAKTMGKKGTATLGWSLSDIQKILYLNSPVETMYFLPDWGVDAATKLTYYQISVQQALQFVDYKNVYVVNPYSEVLQVYNDELGRYPKDANEFGKRAVLEELRQTQKLTLGLAMNILTEKPKVCL